MPASPLAVDLSSGTVRVLEGMPGGPMRCAEGGTPDGAVDGGRILDPAGVGAVLRQVLARGEISTSRALIAASDSIASFRVLSFPKDTPDADVDAAIKTQLPSSPDRLSVRRTEVSVDLPQRNIHVTVWDRDQVRAIVDTARHAGLEPTVVDLRSLCIARAIRIPNCVVLDLSSEPFEVVLIEDHIPRAWHSFKAGQNGDPTAYLVAGLKLVLGYQRSAGGPNFTEESPIVVRSDQVMPSATFGKLQEATGHPVEALPQPPRVDPELRFNPYLACVGLVMRRQQ